ncbi:MAG: hypothetical protein ACKO0Z_13975 [Betaproteobacteria bacterium]
MRGIAPGVGSYRGYDKVTLSGVERHAALLHHTACGPLAVGIKPTI